ncbi:geranylgeranyl transferase type-1 subunit beta-like isoform X2 [Watersipora subatra]|uniref:geranylgeranyl transferase type-1 subunit beta-like isoform X2 n=1 Tax=Watersipora subatra TaxID=2589382 RepID=UPI00355C5E86
MPKQKCKGDGLSDMSASGFRGSTWTGASFVQPQTDKILYDSGHVAMTYTALCTLLVLGDDLSRVDKQAIAYGLKNLQLENGSFQYCVEGSEDDMRFIYCVAAVCYILNDYSTIDVEKAVNYIIDSLSYEGGFGQRPFTEAVGGSTYCAVAALYLFNKLDRLKPSELALITQWCLNRQQSGFQGRPNKAVDTCYSFWLGATLQILDSFQHVNHKANRDWLLSVQDYMTGGFSKWTTTSPDPLHSYLGLAGLALMHEEGVQSHFSPLNISQRAANHLHNLQNSSSW